MKKMYKTEASKNDNIQCTERKNVTNKRITTEMSDRFSKSLVSPLS